MFREYLWLLRPTIHHNNNRKRVKNHNHTLTRSERLRGKKTTDILFSGSGGRALSAFPLRMVYMNVPRTDGEPAAQMLVSVAKRRLRHAVDRNRVKRQVREAYRLNKHKLHSGGTDKTLIAFIYLDNKLHNSRLIAARMERLLQRLGERQMKTAYPGEANKFLTK